MQRAMHTGHVGQIFLEAFHRLENPLGARLGGEVIGRIAGELLGEVNVRELPPAAVAFGLGDVA